MNNVIFKRLAMLYKYVFVLLAIAILGKIIYLQYINPTDIKAEDISYREEKIEAVRGDILSKDGRPMAISVPYYQIRLDCIIPNQDTFDNNIDELCKSLANFFKDKSAKKYKQDLVTARKEGKRYKSIGNRLLDYAELDQVKKFPILRLGANKGGLIVEQKYKRNNPYGRLAYRTIGFINTLGVGVGIEGTSDMFLKGTPGYQIVQKVLGGEWKPVNGGNNIEPKDGYDIQTTIDIEIQEAAEKALREQLAKGDNVEGATALVMEVKTGAIRAIANMKKVGPNKYDESYNYAIGDATEPGSVFKLVTLIALLEDDYVTLETPIDAGNGKWTYGGHTYSDTRIGGYGLLNVKKAFAKSSNVAFAKLAVDHYGNNQKKFADRVQNMKIGERFNLDIQGEARATIYTPDEPMWSRSSLTSMAIGYSTLITPLHTLTFYNAIANKGRMMKPYFIDNYQQNGEIIKQFKPQEISGSICSKETAEKAIIALRAVVEEGTGSFMNKADYKIAGKTGTSRIAYGGKIGYEKNGYRRYQASFVGFYPADNPKYSAIVVLYSGDTRSNFYGGSQAGPVFKQIADHIYATSNDWNEPINKTKKLEKNFPDVTTGKYESQKIVLSELGIDYKITDKIKDNSWLEFKKDSLKITAKSYIPQEDSLINVVNMGIKDAVYILENQGYNVNFSGYGKVISQSPKAGSIVKKNSIINLELSGNES